MRSKTYMILLLTFSIFVIGCSKEKKDEAAELAKQLEGDSIAMMDSLAEVQRVTDSVAATEVIAEPEAIVEEPTKMPKQPAGEGYTVQVAGCEERDYAEYLVELYKGRGYEPYVTSITIEGQGYYRVRIGIFASLGDAKVLQNELNDKYTISSWVDVTVNNY